uniref:Putative secreted protein n=1 Tax=Ixodes ricinus TaxID=34613 RepID=A0A6B0U3E5_IXORI
MLTFKLCKELNVVFCFFLKSGVTIAVLLLSYPVPSKRWNTLRNVDRIRLREYFKLIPKKGKEKKNTLPRYQ